MGGGAVFPIKMHINSLKIFSSQTNGQIWLQIGINDHPVILSQTAETNILPQ